MPDVDRAPGSEVRPSPDALRTFAKTGAADVTAPVDKSPGVGAELPTPLYTSWEDYLACTTERERLEWCHVKSKTTNRRRLASDRAARAITAQEVWQVAEAAQGRCTYCGSLALEGRPSGHDGRPTP